MLFCPPEMLMVATVGVLVWATFVMLSVVALPDATVRDCVGANNVLVGYSEDLTYQLTPLIVFVPRKRDQSTL